MPNGEMQAALLSKWVRDGSSGSLYALDDLVPRPLKVFGYCGALPSMLSFSPKEQHSGRGRLSKRRLRTGAHHSGAAARRLISRWFLRALSVWSDLPPKVRITVVATGTNLRAIYQLPAERREGFPSRSRASRCTLLLAQGRSSVRGVSCPRGQVLCRRFVHLDPH
jgi:hypothetical protein